MTIGIYSKYFESEGIGGGERYMLAIASHWSKSHTVDLLTDKPALVENAAKRFDLDIQNVHVRNNFIDSGSLLTKLINTSKYDVMVFLTDGSVPISFARKNILHVQVPFAHFDAPTIKLSLYGTVVCNSMFTKNNMDPRLRGRASVIYPPVEIDVFPQKKKAKKILTVGRFSSQYQAKKQDVLIDAFSVLSSQAKWKDYELILAGGFQATDAQYLESLKKRANGKAVTFYPNCTREKLLALYAQSTYYWHAAGVGEDDPTKMEHFGISTVEAMAAGCVVFVYNGGGLPEIVTHGKTGFLWSSTDDLTAQMNNTVGVIDTVSKAAVLSAHRFDQGHFFKSIDELLHQ